MHTYLSDRQRIELILPPLMMLEIIENGVYEEKKIDKDYQDLKANLLKAIQEPVSSFTSDKAVKLIERAGKLYKESLMLFAIEGMQMGKLGLVVFYVIKRLVEDTYLQYRKDSAIDLAMHSFMDSLQEWAQDEKNNNSAQKQAKEMLRYFQMNALYMGVATHDQIILSSK